MALTTGNQLYSIDNMFFSARRPHGDNMLLANSAPGEEDKNKEGKEIKLKSAEYPPYDAVIPYLSTKFLSYELHLVDLNEIFTFPTRLESMTSILAYGFDVFFIRVSPENNFDLL